MALWTRLRKGDDALDHDSYLISPGRQTERAIRVLLIIGAISLAGIVSSGLASGGGVRFVIWALIAAFSAAVLGGAFGLLFGLPTSPVGAPPMTAPQPPPTPAPTPAPQGSTGQATTPPPAVTSPASPSAPATSTDPRELDIGYRDSTSLEQVADWLTKIIVGLTLTQFSSWEVRFEAMSRNLTEAMAGPLGRSADCLQLVEPLRGAARLVALESPVCQVPPASAVPGGVLIALGATIGFLISYLWMRRYFILEMVVARRAAGDFLNVKEAKAKSDVAAQTVQQTQSELRTARAAEEKLKADLERVQAEVALQKAALERTQAEAALQKEEQIKEKVKLEEALRVAGKRGLAQTKREATDTPEAWAVKMLQKGRALLPPASEGVNAVAAIEQTVSEKDMDPLDPWRRLFGEQSTVGNLSLGAEVDETPDPDTFLVKLSVRTLESPPPEALVGTKVVYYLHPTFGGQPRRATFDDNGQAPLEFFAYGAFTVGVVTENGTTLELNLATLSAAPITFRSR